MVRPTQPLYTPGMLGLGIIAYAVLSFAACVGAWLAFDRLPFSVPDPWLQLSGGMASAYSLLLGGAFGGAIVVWSRASVGRFRWAQRLHQEFRPIARQLSTSDILILAALSGVAEEFMFRGLLQPLIGIVPQALVFGLVHQVRGPSRWVWAAWAAGVGLGLGVLFQLTGSIWGPVLAHSLINAINLSYLKNHDPEPPTRALGGLLDRGSG
jgi:membrane protease YdiL (CAAX protease family)